jgi:hypothetical protein
MTKWYTSALSSFDSGDDYVAALVIEGAVKRVKFWDWS